VTTPRTNGELAAEDLRRKAIGVLKNGAPHRVDAGVGVVDRNPINVLAEQEAKCGSGTARIGFRVDPALESVEADQARQHVRKDLLAAGVSKRTRRAH